MLLLTVLIATVALGSVQFEVGAGIEQIRTPVPFVNMNFHGDYFMIDNDLGYRPEFGIIDMVGLSLKFKGNLAPFFGLSGAFGYNVDEGPFFEHNGLIFNGGVFYENERYSILLKMGQYMTFDGEFSAYPILKITCSFTIGEW